MADYTPYIPTVGSIDYPTQLSTFITLSEAIDTEIELARNGNPTLLAHINQKLELTGGTLTGSLSLNNTSPTIWFLESGVSVDNGKWSFAVNAEEFSLRANNDALNIINNVFNVSRTGAVVDGFNINTTCSIEKESPIFYLKDTAGSTATDEKNFRIVQAFGATQFSLFNDALNLQSTFMNISRNGYNVNSIRLFALTNSSVKINDNTVWNAGNDGITSGLDADLLHGVLGSNYARLDTSSIFTSIPGFNGGTSGSTSPFTVDSTDRVINLNADLLDGEQGSSYLRSNTSDTMSGLLTLTGGSILGGNSTIISSGVGGNEGGELRLSEAPNGTTTENPFMDILLDDFRFVIKPGGITRVYTLDSSAPSGTIALLSSPVFTGAPLLPTNTIATTQATGDITTKIATTAFVDSSISSASSTAKAWVNFNGTGTVAIRDSLNVSSITDLGVGTYQINFATAMATADYAVVGTMSGPDRRNSMISENLLTTSFALECTTNNVGNQDHDVVSAIVFGGQ